MSHTSPESADTTPTPAEAAPGSASTAGGLGRSPDPLAPGLKRRGLRVPKALRTPLGIIGAVILLIWLFVAIFAHQLAPHDSLAQDFTRLAPPGSENLLGTDTLGRDVLSRVLVSAQTTLPAAVFVVICSAVLGSTLGAIAGYFGRAVDEIIMRFADLVFAFPTIILAMVIAAALGPGLKNAIIAILLVSWPSYARVTRSLVMTSRNSEYVIAGRLLGFSAGKSLIREIAPNVLSPVVVLATLDVGSAILTMAGLSFLSLGVVPPTPDWGAMVSEGVSQFAAWWIAFFPGLCILTIVMAFNFIGDSLRDSLDPHTAQEVGEQTS